MSGDAVSTVVQKTLSRCRLTFFFFTKPPPPSDILGAPPCLPGYGSAWQHDKFVAAAEPPPARLPGRKKRLIQDFYPEPALPAELPYEAFPRHRKKLRTWAEIDAKIAVSTNPPARLPYHQGILPNAQKGSFLGELGNSAWRPAALYASLFAGHQGNTLYFKDCFPQFLPYAHFQCTFKVCELNGFGDAKLADKRYALHTQQAAANVAVYRFKKGLIWHHERPFLKQGALYLKLLLLDAKKHMLVSHTGGSSFFWEQKELHKAWAAGPTASSKLKFIMPIGNDAPLPLQHQGYYGSIFYDANASCLHGHVLGIPSLITYQAPHLAALKQQFKTRLQQYLNHPDALQYAAAERLDNLASQAIWADVQACAARHNLTPAVYLATASQLTQTQSTLTPQLEITSR